MAAFYTFFASTWVGVKNFGFTEKQKNIEQGSRGYPGPGGVLPLISPLILLQLCIDFTSSSCLTKLKELHVSEPGIAQGKKEEISRGVRGHAPPENFESRD